MRSILVLWTIDLVTARPWFCRNNAVQDVCEQSVMQQRVAQIEREVHARDAPSPALGATSYELTGIGPFQPTIRLSPSSYLFGCRSDLSRGLTSAPYAMKYVSNCDQLRSQGPSRPWSTSLSPRGNKVHADMSDELLKEFVMGKFLDEHNIVPKMIWMSGPGVWTEGMSHLVSVPVDNVCFRLKSTVRVILMEKAGSTVDELAIYADNSRALDDGREMQLLYLKRIIAIAKAATALLAKLHALGIVHGNITGEAIALRTGRWRFLRQDESYDFVLTDLSRCEFICSPEKNREMLHPDSSRYHLLSIWELEGKGVRGFRDDMYRLFGCIANYVGRKNTLQNIFLSSVNPGDHTAKNLMQDLKIEIDFFHASSVFDAFATYTQVSDKTKSFVRSQLGSIMDSIQALDSPSQRVPFGFINDKLNLVIAALDKDLDSDIDADVSSSAEYFFALSGKLQE